MSHLSRSLRGKSTAPAAVSRRDQAVAGAAVPQPYRSRTPMQSHLCSRSHVQPHPHPTLAARKRNERGIRSSQSVRAGLAPAIPLGEARPHHANRDAPGKRGHDVPIGANEVYMVPAGLGETGLEETGLGEKRPAAGPGPRPVRLGTALARRMWRENTAAARWTFPAHLANYMD